MHIMSLAKTWLTAVHPGGSGIGQYLRTKIPHPTFRQFIGVNLAGFTFFAAVVVPQVQSAVSSIEVSLNTQKNVIIVDTSPSIYQWPLRSFGISQLFSVVHPGMDLTDPFGTPVYPIGDGVVTWIKYIGYGYGFHALVTHPDGMMSLYAHMSKIYVHEGQEVTKTDKIGNIGLTGWTTGSHLHFEVYQDQLPTNPLEVLPAIASGI